MNKKVTEKKDFKKIKENITEVEYKKLMSFTRGNETLRNNTKLNLLRTFTILFFTGLRLNEVQELKIINIKNLIENKNVKIELIKFDNSDLNFLKPINTDFNKNIKIFKDLVDIFY